MREKQRLSAGAMLELTFAYVSNCLIKVGKSPRLPGSKDHG